MIRKKQITIIRMRIKIDTKIKLKKIISEKKMPKIKKNFLKPN